MFLFKQRNICTNDKLNSDSFILYTRATFNNKKGEPLGSPFIHSQTYLFTFANLFIMNINNY